MHKLDNLPARHILILLLITLAHLAPLLPPLSLISFLGNQPLLLPTFRFRPFNSCLLTSFSLLSTLTKPCRFLLCPFLATLTRDTTSNGILVTRRFHGGRCLRRFWRHDSDEAADGRRNHGRAVACLQDELISLVKHPDWRGRSCGVGRLLGHDVSSRLGK